MLKSKKKDMIKQKNIEQKNVLEYDVNQKISLINLSRKINCYS